MSPKERARSVSEALGAADFEGQRPASASPHACSMTNPSDARPRCGVLHLPWRRSEATCRGANFLRLRCGVWSAVQRAAIVCDERLPDRDLDGAISLGFPRRGAPAGLKDRPEEPA
jgi:hypothetical protein